MTTSDVPSTVIEPVFDETQYDAEQLKLMEERLILLDYNDKPIGSESKKTCPCPVGFTESPGLRAREQAT